MRRAVTYPFLGLAVFLFCWINLPKSGADRLRSFAITPFSKRSSETGGHDSTRAQLENQNLRMQLEHAYDWLLYDQRINGQLGFLKGLEERAFCEKKAAHLKEVLKSQLFAIPAQVVYRDPSSWSSSLWVNVGDENNRALGKPIIGKNSPVLADGALVGVVDYVGKNQARVRLITDSGLCPAVRVSRGATQNRELGHQIQGLLNQIEKREDLTDLVSQLKKLEEKTGLEWEDGYLAKGEVHGSSAPFWRSRGPILKGVGFNFDYPDEEGAAKVPMIKEGDLLVDFGPRWGIPQRPPGRDRPFDRPFKRGGLRL